VFELLKCMFLMLEIFLSSVRTYYSMVFLFDSIDSQKDYSSVELLAALGVIVLLVLIVYNVLYSLGG
jgi:hypothetical protein